MHQPRRYRDKIKSSTRLFGVGCMLLLGDFIIILIFCAVGLFCWWMGWLSEKVRLNLSIAGGVAAALYCAYLEDWRKVKDKENKGLRRQQQEQQHILEYFWSMNGHKPNDCLSFSEVQPLFSEAIPAFFELHPNNFDQIPKAEQYSVLRDICEESWSWILDTIRSVLRRGLHKIIYCFSFIMRLFKGERNM